ncbi:Aste57867_15544 [Aphanomyces stellatus]|uniref:Aste57867_15544 protein n=1 Tax=Aphanomyces stellatus TaxID=120398 RepID=A0A485L4D5_9STRA|nr:hypothetical protein As57867_015488 [Aphanomyces stellatus]VFT92346.1 Aste57867_15544 [Aphanomyces stellatus]
MPMNDTVSQTKFAPPFAKRASKPSSPKSPSKPAPRPASKPAPAPPKPAPAAPKPAPVPPPAPPKSRPAPPPSAPSPKRPSPAKPIVPKPRATPIPHYVYVPQPVYVSRPSTVVVVYTRPLYWTQAPCSLGTCHAEFDRCMWLYDGCACFPGLLRCARAHCRAEYDTAMHECHVAYSYRPSCRLQCNPRVYPTPTNVQYKVVSSVRIQGTTAAAFAGSEFDFTQAVAAAMQNATLANASQVVVTMTNETTVGASRGRNLEFAPLDMDGSVTIGGRGPSAVLFIDFEVDVASNASMYQVQFALDQDMQRPNGSSIMASSLLQSGVLFNASQLSFEYTLSAIDPTTVEDDEFDWEVGTELSSSDNALAFSIVCTLLALLACLYCRYRRKQQRLEKTFAQREDDKVRMLGPTHESSM